jgi:mono/diheme cytochrome c family protein
MKSLFTRAGLVAALAFAAAPALAQVASVQDRGDSAGSDSKVTAPITGEQVYTHICQACHMANAKGGSGAATIPALASNPRLAADTYLVTMIVKGRGAMPGFTDILPPPQIANVATYVRTHFGNNYPKPVTTAEVLQIAGAKAAR